MQRAQRPGSVSPRPWGHPTAGAVVRAVPGAGEGAQRWARNGHASGSAAWGAGPMGRVAVGCRTPEQVPPAPSCPIPAHTTEGKTSPPRCCRTKARARSGPSAVLGLPRAGEPPPGPAPPLGAAQELGGWCPTGTSGLPAGTRRGRAQQPGAGSKPLTPPCIAPASPHPPGPGGTVSPKQPPVCKRTLLSYEITQTILIIR